MQIQEHRPKIQLTHEVAQHQSRVCIVRNRVLRTTLLSKDAFELWSCPPWPGEGEAEHMDAAEYKHVVLGLFRKERKEAGDW